MIHTVQLTNEEVAFLESFMWEAMDDHHSWMFELLDSHDAKANDDVTCVEEFYDALERIKGQLRRDDQKALTTCMRELKLCDGIFGKFDLLKRAVQASKEDEQRASPQGTAE